MKKHLKKLLNDQDLDKMCQYMVKKKYVNYNN